MSIEANLMGCWGPEEKGPLPEPGLFIILASQLKKKFFLTNNNFLDIFLFLLC